MKNLILLLSVVFLSTSVFAETDSRPKHPKCGYKKAMKFNHRQSRKHHRHNSRHRSERMFINF